jgi:hypothetical protein
LKANIIGEAPAALDPNLKMFTVFSWIWKRGQGGWNTIAESTPKGEDLAKFMKHLEDDE